MKKGSKRVERPGLSSEEVDEIKIKLNKINIFKGKIF